MDSYHHCFEQICREFTKSLGSVIDYKYLTFILSATCSTRFQLFTSKLLAFSDFISLAVFDSLLLTLQSFCYETISSHQKVLLLVRTGYYHPHCHRTLTLYKLKIKNIKCYDHENFSQCKQKRIAKSNNQSPISPFDVHRSSPNYGREHNINLSIANYSVTLIFSPLFSHKSLCMCWKARSGFIVI